jgi:ribonuclease-3
MVDNKKVATADDFNKKSAEQTASEKAMVILGILADSGENNFTEEEEEEEESVD